jgi:hypothetical protein
MNMDCMSTNVQQGRVVERDGLKEISMDKLEQVNRFKQSFQNWSDTTEEGRFAKRRKLKCMLQ